MVIELQKIRVEPEVRDLYLEKDREIWTAVPEGWELIETRSDEVA